MYELYRICYWNFDVLFLFFDLTLFEYKFPITMRANQGTILKVMGDIAHPDAPSKWRAGRGDHKCNYRFDRFSDGSL